MLEYHLLVDQPFLLKPIPKFRVVVMTTGPKRVKICVHLFNGFRGCDFI